MPEGLNADHFVADRNVMVAAQLRGRGITDQRVLDAMARVPRHEFVPERDRSQAYEDHPIPIGKGQTISQPYIVALMLQALSLDASHSALEIGTGSGYQTALLAELVYHVYSVERHAQLANEARTNLSRLGFHNVTIVVADGTHGLPAHAPFDAIIVSAAAQQIPPPLFDQLKENGRIVMPVGPPQEQELHLVRKINAHPQITLLGGCRFVPLLNED